MPIIIHKTNGSPPARTVLAIVEILGLDIEAREVNILKKEHFAQEYLEKNPLHTVPLLEDGDFILSDSHAIIIYLVSKYGAQEAATFYPNNLQDRAIIHQRVFFDASILFPRLHATVGDVIHKGAISISKDRVASIEEAYGFLEKYLERSSFVAGENITIADIACITTTSTLNTMVPLEDKYPKIQAWLETLSTEHWYQKQNQPGLTEFELTFASLLQKNVEKIF